MPHPTAPDTEGLLSWQVAEHFGIGWPEQAVSIELDPQLAGRILAENAPLRVVDETGRAVPAQLSGTPDRPHVWYLAALAPHQTKHYRLQFGEPSLRPALRFAVEQPTLELGNAAFAARLGWPVTGKLDAPTPLAELPGPIQAIRGPDGVWFGRGRWQGSAICLEVRCEILESGPVLWRVRQMYALADGNELAFEYQVDAATPALRVTQTCTADAVDARAVWQFGPAEGFAPTHAFWRPHSTPAWRGTKENWNRQVYRLRWQDTPDDIYLTAFYNWIVNGSMFWSCWSEQAGRDDLLLIGAIRPSQTRCASRYRPLEVSAWNDEAGRQLAFSTPMQAGQKQFCLSILDRHTALPESGAPESGVENLYRQLHCLGLNEYHHMALEWPGMRDIAFPHVMITPDGVGPARDRFRDWDWLRNQFESHVNDRLFLTHDQDDMRIRPEVRTLGSDWAGAYLATGDVTYAHKARQVIDERLKQWVRLCAALGPTVDELIGISFARLWRPTCIAFDMVAASQAFTGAERQDFLRRIAFVAEIAASDDAWPQSETGLDRANPNFHTDFFSAKGICAALLNGHPRQRDWMAYAFREAVNFLRTFHHEGGCGVEAATYQMVGLAYMTLLSTAIRNAGGPDLFETEPILKSSFDYLASSQTPRDPRTGFCMLPTVGHVTVYGWCQSLQTYFAWAAQATARTDPGFSRRMMAAWQRAGALPISLHEFYADQIWWEPLCLIDRALPAQAEHTHPGSRLHEGLGAIFRTVHANGEEGYLLVKMGASRGHFDPDEGSLIWYAYGQPLLTDFGCQYNPNIECAWLHNRISFDYWNETGEHHFRVVDHLLNDEFDYILGEMTVSQLYTWGDWPIRETQFNFRLHQRRQTIEPVVWRRHILYIHACEAVVILDEVEGRQPTDWNVQVLADELRLGQGRAHFRGQRGVDLDVHFARPATPDLSASSFEHLGFNEPRLPFYWWKAAQWAAPPGTCFGPLGERALTLRARIGDPIDARGEPSQAYLALLLARRTGEAPASVDVLANGEGFEWHTGDAVWRVSAGAGNRPWRLVMQQGDGVVISGQFGRS